MVFCGKPSKGCSNCRERRIKCDQLNPSCSQCLRVRKSCPGYRNQLNLLFRDESEKVVQRSRGSKSSLEQHRASPVQDQLTSCVEIAVEPTSSAPSNPVSPLPYGQSMILAHSSPVRSLPSPLVDEGVHFFFTRYVVFASTLTASDDSELILPTFSVWPTLFSSDAFFNAVSSVGFAGLSNVTQNPRHAVVARRKYAATLRTITESLQNPSTADLATTFKSVLLLAAFEIIGPRGGGGSWGVHLDGGAAILKLMSADNHANPFPSYRMPFQFIFSLYGKCLCRGDIPPVGLKEWIQNLTKAIDPVDRHITYLADAIYQFTELRCKIKTLHIDSYTAIQEALEIDAQLKKWDENLPSAWKIERKELIGESEIVYDRHLQAYRDSWTARVFNNYRWSRILINQLIIVHMAQLGLISAEHKIQREKSLDIILHMAIDTCSGVASQFYLHRNEKLINYAPPMSVCLLLLFPLTVAGSAMGVPDELHEWCFRTLEMIGHNMGVFRALKLAKITRKQRERWKTLSSMPEDSWWLESLSM